MQTNNITLALSLNYSPTFLNPFLKSYEKYASGELWLITDLPQDNILQTKKIKFINFNDVVKKYNVATNLTAFNLKPIIFYLLLKELKDIKNVLITDVDVIFQDDPFTVFNNIEKNDLIVCEERKTFNQCEVNTTWLRVCYPQYENILLDKKILNSGVVFGTKQNIQNYFKLMIDELKSILPRCNYPIMDQIILNKLFYIRKEIAPTLLTHKNKYIIHLSQEDKNSINQNNIQNNFFILDNIKSAIVHQFNKQPFLNSFYTQLYS